MTLWTLLRKEILYRKGSFGLGLLSITAAAMTAGIGSVVLLQAHDVQTEHILRERQRATQAEMQKMEDDYRRITRELGHNTLILSEDQNLAEREHRQDIAQAQRRFASVLTPLAFAGAGLWIFFLFLTNARERRIEIGILRALGVGESTLLYAFLLKSLAMGLIGAGLGFMAGHLFGSLWSGLSLFQRETWALLDVRLLAGALLAAPALCGLAAWLPAVRAIRQDPARILCEE